MFYFLKKTRKIIYEASRVEPSAHQGGVSTTIVGLAFNYNRKLVSCAHKSCAKNYTIKYLILSYYFDKNTNETKKYWYPSNSLL